MTTMKKSPRLQAATGVMVIVTSKCKVAGARGCPTVLGPRSPGEDGVGRFGELGGLAFATGHGGRAQGAAAQSSVGTAGQCRRCG